MTGTNPSPALAQPTRRLGDGVPVFAAEGHFHVHASRVEAWDVAGALRYEAGDLLPKKIRARGLERREVPFDELGYNLPPFEEKPSLR